MNPITGQTTVEQDIDNLRIEAAAIETGVPAKAVEAAEKTSNGSERTDDQAEEMGLTAGDSETETATQEGEATQEDHQEGEDAQSTGDGDEAAPKTRQQKKDEALTRSWENADKRHREADEREKALAGREARIIQAEQQLKARQDQVPNDPLPKYTPGEIGQALVNFIEDGDLDTAKNLALQLAQKADAGRVASVPGLQNPEFRQAWDANRDKLVETEPELKDANSTLYKEASALLQGPWATILTSHPAGINAAVEVAKLRLAAGSVSELQKQVEQLTKQNQELLRKTQLRGSGASSRETVRTSDKFASLPVERQIDALYQEAASRGS